MEGSPGVVKKRKKLSHIQIRCNLLDFHSLFSFLLYFQTNASEDFSPPSSEFQRVSEGNKQNASFLSF